MLWDTVVGGLIGVSAGLSTTALTLRHSTKAKERERELNLLRDVFLEAAAGLEQTGYVIANAARLEVPKEQLQSPLAESPKGWLSRVFLVASPSTFRAVAFALDCFGNGLAELVLDRIRIERVDVNLGVLRRQMDGTRAAQNHAVQSLNTLANRELSPDEVAFSRSLYHDLQLMDLRLVDDSSQEQRLLDERLELQLDLLRKTVRISHLYREATANALGEMRRQIDFGVDVSELFVVLEESLSRQRATYDATMKALQSDDLALPARGGGVASDKP